MYSVEGLERAIEAAKKNIKTFEEAIDREYASIKQWRHMIREIDRKAAERESVKGPSNDDQG